MTAFVIPLVVFLAAVFAVSAIGKLRSPDRGRAGFIALQLPVRNSAAAALALIVAEAVVALALVISSGWLLVAAGAAALALTVGLTIVVVRAHRRGATDDCGCFGDWLPAAIGPRLIVRNVILTVIAAAVFASALLAAVTSTPLGLPLALMSRPSAVVALGAIAAALLIAAGVWSIIRAATAPSPTGAIPRGAGAVLVAASAEIVDVLAPSPRAQLLVFVARGCHACAAALASLSAAESSLTRLVDIYVVQRAVGGSAEVRPVHDLPASARFALDVGGSLGMALGVGTATPVGVLIGTDGIQAGPQALGSDEVELLIDSIRALADVPSP